MHQLSWLSEYAEIIFFLKLNEKLPYAFQVGQIVGQITGKTHCSGTNANITSSNTKMPGTTIHSLEVRA
jgi:hypothetical protein